MTEEEFWLIMEVRQQAMGKLTDSDYEAIGEFVDRQPKQRMSIKRGKTKNSRR